MSPHVRLLVGRLVGLTVIKFPKDRTVTLPSSCMSLPVALISSVIILPKNFGKIDDQIPCHHVKKDQDRCWWIAMHGTPWCICIQKCARARAVQPSILWLRRAKSVARDIEMVFARGKMKREVILEFGNYSNIPNAYSFPCFRFAYYRSIFTLPQENSGSDVMHVVFLYYLPSCENYANLTFFLCLNMAQRGLIHYENLHTFIIHNSTQTTQKNTQKNRIPMIFAIFSICQN